MFLDVLRRRNPAFLDAVVKLHRAGDLPAGCYVVDLDAVSRNASRLRAEADRLSLEIFAMTKQVSRGAPFIAAVRRGGIEQGVAVDLQCAAACRRADFGLGHVGHLVQVPRVQAATVSAMNPANWTVFDLGKAGEAAQASQAAGRVQSMLARIAAPGDRFYPGHEGGFEAERVLEVAEAIDSIPGARFAGVTTFPAALFDRSAASVRPTPNLATLGRAAERLAKAGRGEVRVNAPGTTSTVTLAMLADAGATQVEPGHALTGTTPLHAVEDLPEEPAVLFLSEISHHAAGRAYCFGGGLYVDPVFPSHEMRALVAEGEGADARTLVSAEIPPPEAIDYYGMLSASDGRRLAQGATVIFGFRVQAFVTRAPVAGLLGVGTDEVEVAGLWRHDGTPVEGS